MFKSIPISSIVSIVPSVLGGGGNPLALNGAMIVKGLLDKSSPVREVTAFEDFKTIFHKEDLETVEAYFKGPTIATQRPDKLIVAVMQDEAWAASLMSAELTPWQSGKGADLSMSLTVDGALKEVTSIDYDKAGSYSNIASQISSQIDVEVKFNEASRRFVITSSSTGNQSTISTATGTLAEALKLNYDQGALAINGGVADESIQDSMDRIFRYTQNFGAIFTSFSLSEAQGIEFAKWVNAKDQRFAGIIWTVDPRAAMNGQTSIATKITENNYSGIVCVYGDARYAAAISGYGASINFSELRGRMTLDFRTFEGLPASVDDAGEAAILEKNGYTFYGAFATANDRFLFFRNSRVSGQFEWLDTYLNQVYFNAQLQLAMITMLRQNKAVPYNAEGDALIAAAAQDPINEMLNFGGIVSGINLSENQTATINRETGIDAARQVSTKGYFFRIGESTSQARANRTTPPLKLWYSDGGSIHNISLASIAVQ